MGRRILTLVNGALVAGVAMLLIGSLVGGNARAVAKPSATTRKTIPLTTATTAPPVTTPKSTTTRPRASSTTATNTTVTTAPPVVTVPRSFGTTPFFTVAPTTATSTTTTTIAPIGGQLPVSPSTLPLTTKGTSAHVDPVFAWLSGAGFLVALLIMGARFIASRPGRVRP